MRDSLSLVFSMVYRIGATGIDGACKTAAIDGAVAQLAQEYSICRVGRRFHYHAGDVVEYPLSTLDNLMERIIDLSDRTPPSRLWVGLSQAMFVLMQRFIEPYMERKYKPELIMNSRCTIISPAVYAFYYLPAFSKLNPDERLKVMQRISGAKFPDLYFLFEVSTDVALQRISDYNEIIKRSHPHETRETIEQLQREFLEVMSCVALMPNVKIIGVNSSDKSIKELSDIVAKETKQFIQDNPHLAVFQ